MGAVPGQRARIDGHGIAADHGKAAIGGGGKFGQRGQGAVITLNRKHLRTGAKQSASKAAGAGADFVDA